MTDTESGRSDTPGGAAAAFRTARALVAIVLAALLTCLCAEHDRATADPLPLDAKVIWVAKDRAVIASDEPLALAQGDIIRFVSHDKEIALGVVMIDIEPRIVVVSFGADVRAPVHGSLAGVKKLDRLRMLADRRSLQAPPQLRLGYPAGRRSNLLFDCEDVTPRPPGPEGVYRTERLTDHRFRLVRNPDAVARAPWPDTLLIRLFDESADEEIAMERGDLDVAMFWPGEISPHARRLWPEAKPLYASRTRGLLAAMLLGPGTLDDSVAASIPVRQALSRLQPELFDQDLVRDDDHPDSLRQGSHPDSSWRDAPRFEVDHAIPGWQVLERFLNTRPGSKTVEPGAYKIWLFFLDAPWDDAPSIARSVAERLRSGPVPQTVRARADSLVAETRAPGYPVGGSGLDELQDHLRDRLHVHLQALPGCPLLYRPGIGPYVWALRPESLVDLLGCSPTAPR